VNQRTFQGSPAAQTAWPPQGQWTYEDDCRLPEDAWRYEVIRGGLFMAPAPRPRRQRASFVRSLGLEGFNAPRRLGTVFTAPIDLLLPGLASPVQPDVLFALKEHLSIVKEENIVGVPGLIVEILSPSNWIVDRRDTFDLYAEAGVKEHWIIDLDGKTVEVFTLRAGASALHGRCGPGETAKSALLAGFEIAVDGMLGA